MTAPAALVRSLIPAALGIALGIPLVVGPAAPAQATGSAPRDAGTTALAAADLTTVAAGSGLGPRQGITDGPCTVYGWVTTPTGQPAANVSVRWSYIPLGSDVNVYGNSTTTDAAGYYSFSGVRATQFGSIYSYWGDDTFARQGFVWRSGLSLLELSSAVQICTLKASRTSIRRGAAIRLSGVVPTEGHWGNTRGKRKRVDIYQRTKSRADSRRSGSTLHGLEEGRHGHGQRSRCLHVGEAAAATHDLVHRAVPGRQ